jgi:BirA family biotin operon repressor/biotin-[acetyl-CoA-carboxylase] ligase
LPAADALSLLVPGEWVSGEDMARRQGISRAAVWKQIQALRRRGYRIASSTRRGYLLMDQPDLLDADRIKKDLVTNWLGRNLLILAEASSTNAVALSSISQQQSGSVILAETQKEGRGRLSRSWASPPGGIWMSLVLRPDIPLSRVYRINMAASVSICRAISQQLGLQAGIKWPNDILIQEQKVCGILMELGAQVDRLDYVVVGVGLNANNDIAAFPSQWRSTSLAAELGRSIDRCALIAAILNEMEQALDDMESQEIYEEWRRLSLSLGERVRISSAEGDLIGQVVDLDGDGALILQQDREKRRILAGDCIHLRPEGGDGAI